MKDTFYLTTTLPYVNAEPHIGFALEIVAADVIARYQRDILNNKVIFNTGTDEHGQKIYQNAIDNNQDPQAYVDHYAAKFEELKKLLNLSYTHFIRTTDKNHVVAAQKFWEICNNNGYIYKKEYKTKYCIGCELEKTDSELDDGKCPLHPNKELEIREEENYFFKFSAFQQPLLALYEKNPEFVKPAGKMKEIKAFVANGLQDFSISRLKEKMPWGIQVPNDPNHVMYVWFDALVNYISTLGWPSENSVFNQFWPGIQVAGKDNLRQQAAMWQAMLLAAKIQPSEQILINGFISVDGQKMSKSLGNVIAPTEMVKRYGVDATRYLLMNLGPFGTDMDVSWEKLDMVYQSKLANNIGNTISRVAKMCENSGIGYQDSYKPWKFKTRKDGEEAIFALDSAKKEMINFQLRSALTDISLYTNFIEEKLSKEEPWKLEGEKQKEILQTAISSIIELAKSLQPFMPTVSEKIITHFSQEKITALKPLFPRLEK